MADTQLERSLRAWERFFATGDVEAADVRDEILRSSKRCHEAGLDPLGPAVPLSRAGTNWRRRERGTVRILKRLRHLCASLVLQSEELGSFRCSRTPAESC
jgi:hypothetical protein